MVSLPAAMMPSPPLLARGGYLTLGVWVAVGAGDLVQAVVENRPGAGLAAAAAMVILVSALVASVAGFAFCALAGSALAWLKVDPVAAVQAMVLCSIASQAYAVWTIRAAIDWRGAIPMIIAGATTVPVGVWLLLHSNPAIYATGLGIFLSLYGAFHIANRRIAKPVQGRPWQDLAAGALGGLTGGLSGIPGAFVTIWCSMRGWDKLRQRAFYQPYILAMQLLTGGTLVFAGAGADSTSHNLHLVPFALLGAIGGMAVFKRLTHRQFQITVSALLVTSGIGLLARVW